MPVTQTTNKYSFCQSHNIHIPTLIKSQTHTNSQIFVKKYFNFPLYEWVLCRKKIVKKFKTFFWKKIFYLKRFYSLSTTDNNYHEPPAFNAERRLNLYKWQVKDFATKTYNMKQHSMCSQQKETETYIRRSCSRLFVFLQSYSTI